MTQTQNGSFKINTQALSSKIVLYFIGIELLFVFLDLTVNFYRFIDYGPIRRLFNITREDGLASWFMSAQTLLTALTLWFIFFIYKAQKEQQKSQKIGWGILASFFTYMSADDASAIHERLGSTFKLMTMSSHSEFTTSLLNYFPSYAWQLVVLPFFIGMGIFMLLFLYKIFQKDLLMYKIILAFSIFSMAVILDFFEGVEADSPYYVYQAIINYTHVELHTVEHFSKSIEELFEMIGMSIFLSVFIEYSGKMRGKVFQIEL